MHQFGNVLCVRHGADSPRYAGRSMTREPDRFDKRVKELAIHVEELIFDGDTECGSRLRWSLRRIAEEAESSALERAARIAYEERAEAWKSSRAADARGDHYVGAANAVSASVAQRIAERIRTLAHGSPAAA